MSLASLLTDLATRIGTETKSLRTLINGNQPTNGALTTTAKSNLVAAINEVNAAVSSASGIDDGTVSTSATWSSQKISDEIEVVADDLDAFTEINDAATATSSTWSSTKTAAAIAAKTEINDAAASASSTYSSNKIGTQISAAVSALVNSAPGTLDTLKELADALGGDANFATTVSTALGNRVRTDTAAQGLNGTQQGNARTNIDAASATAVGSTTTDFVAAFEAALV